MHAREAARKWDVLTLEPRVHRQHWGMGGASARTRACACACARAHMRMCACTREQAVRWIAYREVSHVRVPISQAKRSWSKVFHACPHHQPLSLLLRARRGSTTTPCIPERCLSGSFSQTAGDNTQRTRQDICPRERCSAGTPQSLARQLARTYAIAQSTPTMACKGGIKAASKTRPKFGT